MVETDLTPQAREVIEPNGQEYEYHIAPNCNGIAYMAGFHLLLGHLGKKVGFAFRDIVFLEKIKKSLFPFYHTQKEEPGPDIWAIVGPN